MNTTLSVAGSYTELFTGSTWLIDDWQEKIPLAIAKKAVRYNHLCKDFDLAPAAYSEFLTRFNRKITKTRTKF